MGAMKGARLVANELHELMWRAVNGHTAGRARAVSRRVFSNTYASLGDRMRFGGEHLGSEAEIDVLAKQLNLSPQAETALRRARKAGKAGKGAKGLKGDRTPLAFDVPVRLRRAAYS